MLSKHCQWYYAFYFNNGPREYRVSQGEIQNLENK